LIWSLASDQVIDLEAGDKIADLDNLCFDVSDPVSITRVENFGGAVALVGGGQSIEVCIADETADVVNFENTGVAANYTYVITDEDDMILASTTESSFDFSDSPAGTCRVWGMAHSDDLTFTVGSALIEPIDEGACFDLSSNFIEVVRVETGDSCSSDPCDVMGGSIELSMSIVCVGDGVADMMTATVTGSSGMFSQLVVTGPAANITALPESNTFEVDESSTGVCLVWNVVSTEPINLEIGANLMSSGNDCVANSPAAVFMKTSVDGGAVSLEGGGTSLEICVGDAGSDVIEFENTSSSSASYQYVITNETNEILAIPSGDSFDMSTLSAGVCRVYQ